MRASGDARRAHDGVDTLGSVHDQGHAPGRCVDEPLGALDGFLEEPGHGLAEPAVRMGFHFAGETSLGRLDLWGWKWLDSTFGVGVGVGFVFGIGARDGFLWVRMTAPVSAQHHSCRG